MSKNRLPNNGAKWLVCEAGNAELVIFCWTETDVKEAITELVDGYCCDPSDIAVLPLATAIPFNVQKVERVHINLTE